MGKDADEVHRDDLLKALELIGFPDPNSTWVQDLMDDHPYSTLDFGEFSEFLARYKVKQNFEQDMLFARFDADGSGSIDSAELADVMTELFSVTPIKLVLDEIVRDITGHESGDINKADFLKAVAVMRQTEGFTRQERQCFQRAFSKCDWQERGRIETNDLSKALWYLGYMPYTQEIAAIGAEVDVGGRKGLDRNEFMRCMKKVREYEISCVWRVLHRRRSRSGKVSCSGSLPINEVLMALGYIPDPTAVLDAATDASQELDEASFDGVWAIVYAFRRRHAFSRNEAADITETFRSQSNNGTDLPASSAVRVMKLLGFCLPYCAVQVLFDKTSMARSDTVNLNELLSLVQLHKQLAVHRAWAALCRDCSVDTTADILVDVEEEKFLRAVRRIIPDAEQVHMGSQSLSCHEFASQVYKLWTAARKFPQTHEGFTELQIAHITEQFQAYLACGETELTRKGLRCVLENFLSGFAATQAGRTQLQKTLEMVDKDGSGSVGFDEFLCLIRHCEEIIDKFGLERERAAIKSTGFTTRDVAEWRELFLGDDCRTALSVDQILEMLGKVLPMGHKNTAALRKIIEMVVPQKNGVRLAEFSEFLRLVQRLSDENVAGINDVVRKRICIATFNSPSASPRRSRFFATGANIGKSPNIAGSKLLVPPSASSRSASRNPCAREHVVSFCLTPEDSIARPSPRL